ncbi:hypothetical protein Rsub_06312 [Raphidocelis subcapitata]|uniref:DUF2232 domain-containing protein n=1 Tax=Raphidocelis subcapitata TaxID=307507 RepID=A0A2V0P3V6_9CHLO|nr:hypothetical protein Rsub_06312 [Raphidocelis subcapitata]|eukprot:GBF93592.1 hypothetical protein Rsub_06312 [Raphidocelis subcapitata]
MQRARAPPGACGSAGRQAAAVQAPRRPRCTPATPTGGAPWPCGTAAGVGGGACALHHQRRRPQRPRPTRAAAAADDAPRPAEAAAAAGLPPLQSSAAGGGALGAAAAVPHFVDASADEEPYSLEDTKALVETAMLAAVSGLAFLLSTLLKLDSSLGYFLPLPIVIAACRSGPAAGWSTMMATSFLLLVLLGPLRAVTYILMHGLTAAALGTMWVWRWPWAVSVLVGSVLRMAGQMGYLLLSSFTMNENLFAVMVANVHNLMDRLSASVGASGAPSDLAIVCMIFALLLVNAVCYNFLMHVIGHIALRAMGYEVGRLPGFMKKYLQV